MQCMMEEVLLTGCLYRSSIIDSTKRVVRCGKWRMLDVVDSMEQEETTQDTRN